MAKSELLIYGLLLIGFLLVNYLVQRAAQRARQQQEQERAQQEAAQPREDEPLEDIWGRTPPLDVTAARAAIEVRPGVGLTAVAPAPLMRRTGASALLGSRQNLRHAIVVMTVLGPCRALEPHDPHQAGPTARGPAPGQPRAPVRSCP